MVPITDKMTPRARHVTKTVSGSFRKNAAPATKIVRALPTGLKKDPSLGNLARACAHPESIDERVATTRMGNRCDSGKAIAELRSISRR
jgi:hypothetical protein